MAFFFTFFFFSHVFRAAKAQAAGMFDSEIIPVTTMVEDAGGQIQTITVSKDEGIRPTTLEGLRKLRPAFKQGGTTTAGMLEDVYMQVQSMSPKWPAA